MKRILLTQGKEALVDDADYEWVSRYKWHAYRSRNTWYAKTRIGSTYVKLHRLLMGLLPGGRLQVDHHNHNGLDNQRRNLRVVSNQENQWNRFGKGFRRTKEGKFRAELKFNCKSVHLGVWDDPRMARAAYLCGKQLFNPIGGN